MRHAPVATHGAETHSFFRQRSAIRGNLFHGRKVFGFTDNLDGLNRWYSDMVDAEQKRRLAKLRLHPHYRSPRQEIHAAELMQMDRQGQIWELPRRLGYNLNQPLMISRCSSQDPGANAGSDLIVASSSRSRLRRPRSWRDTSPQKARFAVVFHPTQRKSWPQAWCAPVDGSRAVRLWR